MNSSLALFLSITPLMTACSGGDESARSTAQLGEVETTVQRGSSITIHRTEIRYDGSHLREVAQFKNGAPAGRAQFTYGAGGITRIDYTDVEGDRASDNLTYEGGRLVRTRYEVPGVLVNDGTITYANGDPKEIATRTTPAGGTTTMHLQRFEYEADGRTNKLLDIEGTSTQMTELRYTPDGLLERASIFDGNAHQDTYSYAYTPEGRLDEVTDTRNGRYELTYDSGRVAEVRWSTSEGTTTTRYTYGAGSVDGWAFAPSVPYAQLFDLDGVSYDTVSLLQGPIEVSDDIARAAGGGGRSGGGGTCGFQPQDTCETCLASSCCDETEACFVGTACDSYYQCTAGCQTQQCIDVCGETNPTGRNDFSAFSSCAQAYCPASCGS